MYSKHLTKLPISEQLGSSDSTFNNMALTGYFDAYRLGGFSSDHMDVVLAALKIHRPNGYGVLTAEQLKNITRIKRDVLMPVLYGLLDSGLIEYLSVKEDHIVFAVERKISEEIKAIQAQSNDHWLNQYDAAESL